MKILIGKFIPKQDNPHDEFEVTMQQPICKVGDEVSERVGKKVDGEDFHVFMGYWSYEGY